MSMHDELKANAAGYALGTLDTEELRAYPAAYAFSSSCVLKRVPPSGRHAI